MLGVLLATTLARADEDGDADAEDGIPMQTGEGVSGQWLAGSSWPSGLRLYHTKAQPAFGVKVSPRFTVQSTRPPTMNTVRSSWYPDSS